MKVLYGISLLCIITCQTMLPMASAPTVSQSCVNPTGVVVTTCSTIDFNSLGATSGLVPLDLVEEFTFNTIKSYFLHGIVTAQEKYVLFNESRSKRLLTLTIQQTVAPTFTETFDAPLYTPQEIELMQGWKAYIARLMVGCP
jgi:hypothetical protein